jgi:SAM-dependent methyltransferase
MKREGGMGTEQDVAAHYRHGGLEAALLAGLTAAGRDPERLRPGDLDGADEFHIGGNAATDVLAEGLALTAAMRLLDLGSGIGGPARHLASRYGCHVTGLELSGEYAEVATSLARRMGLADRVAFRQGSATALPFADASFDGATLLHVGMNIADKAALCAGVFRVLRPGGFFAIYDVMRMAPGEIAFPVPWASTPETSFVEPPATYRTALVAAGFSVVSEHDRTTAARAFSAAMKARQAAGPSPLGLQIVMGANARQKMANLIGLIGAGVVAPVEMIGRK